jgi:hypothetical protein
MTTRIVTLRIRIAETMAALQTAIKNQNWLRAVRVTKILENLIRVELGRREVGRIVGQRKGE